MPKYVSGLGMGNKQVPYKVIKISHDNDGRIIKVYSPKTRKLLATVRIPNKTEKNAKGKGRKTKKRKYKKRKTSKNRKGGRKRRRRRSRKYKRN